MTKLQKFTRIAGAALPLMLVAGYALAQAAAPDAAATAAAAAPPPPPAKLDSGDTAWMLTSSALVLMMTIPGLALFYGGMVRKKNVLAILAQTFACAAVVSVVWFVVAYSLAFTKGSPYIGSLARLFMNGLTAGGLAGADPVGQAGAATIPETVYSMFQLTFAIITPALAVGGFADRMKFSATLWFFVLWMIFVYCPIAHWVWGADGWLNAMGVLDFAGGTVVHINAGVAGLVAALILGKRKGYGTDNMAPHNLILSVIGASLLWVGWFGFNAGSATSSGGAAGMAFLVTHLATAAAALSWGFTEWILRKKCSVLGLISGAVAGLVAITPASGFVNPTGAMIIGIAAGIVCYWGATSVKHFFKYDDALDTFGVHAIGGMLGAILTGVFADPNINGSCSTTVDKVTGCIGLLYGNAGQVITQLYGIVATIIWTGVGTAIILYAIKFTIGLRVTPEQETEGLDLALHGESGYNL